MPPPSVTLVAKLKVQLKLSIARLRMVQQRDEAMGKTQRRAMAQLLEVGKIESARIRTENIIRSDINTELHEILELYCELLLARAALLESPTCDPGLEEAVKSIIYAAPRTEIKELQQVRALLGERFGKEFVLAAMENSDGAVSEKVVKKLSVTPPKPELVQGYLEEIAKAYGVDWPRGSKELGQPPELIDEEVNSDVSGGAEQTRPDADAGISADSKAAQEREDLSRATPPRTFGSSNPLHVNPSSPSTENPRPKVTLNSMELKVNKKPVTTTPTKPREEGKGTGIPDVNELAARFAALKR
ncbi:regulator of Vps4 activity in the MVB pathway-domain-containing protein [Xylaria bambusicola]|uniref:regulator of Vps4 activity in the MVB pathway-domain-containing protein n=1 Tax=Xylaria bambusicola TaxID=326684 RepID=UPI002007CF18|nr:regulator of Vps4 activity in the MVB pathway-domain-containing protein [Xylaria bambusicola]KAI0525982.1 regulator of Vps4 activity in the MVB pathway-domain-containing protein [Xylaria bambusicola]